MLYQSRFIPIGITDTAQPMDVSVMRVFMKRCRELYVAHHIDNDFTPTQSPAATSSPASLFKLGMEFPLNRIVPLDHGRATVVLE
ncbi:hypothetical protein L915_00252 [Phytophthora nicotianae]|uniref:Uncharacterized protein n=1 Tax=Phytophthora nicotianae TaxID=4792 RepID=W2HRK3_PHYNI|nr:hypothetical protein L915_00252 [Phytophthora nicotianae]